MYDVSSPPLPNNSAIFGKKTVMHRTGSEDLRVYFDLDMRSTMRQRKFGVAMFCNKEKYVTHAHVRIGQNDVNKHTL